MKKIWSTLPFFIGVILILFFWKNTILHIFTQIHDWYDGAFMIWTMQSNIKHFSTLDFAHIFETNAMYPFPNSLSFTDHFFVPSFFAFVISLFSTNILLQYNLVSVINHLFVFASFYLLAKRFTTFNWVRLLIALYGSLGPYFFSQFGHLQMIFIWPIVLSIYFLLDQKRRTKSLIFSGLFLGLQFLTGVYLGLMGLFMVCVYFLTLSLFNRKKGNIISIFRSFVIFFIVFIAVSSISIYGYLKVNMEYHPVRDQGDFVTYSAHTTDYALVMFNDSWFNRNLFQPFIGKFNRHLTGERAGFIGLLPLITISFLFFKKKLSKDIKTYKVIIVWTLLLIIFGFIFSLGPRANWNGSYLVTPLPYWFIMKIFSPIAIMRAVSRWYFIVIFSITILFSISLNMVLNLSLKPKIKKALPFLLLVFFLLEFYPTPVKVSAKNWQTPVYMYLQKACVNKPGAILEYPFEYPYKFDDVGKYLSFKTNTLMSSTLHNCPTLSGFSSFEPPLFKKWQLDFDTNGITDVNIKILKQNKFTFVKINPEALSKEKRINPSSVIHTTSLKEVFRDSYSILYKITD